MKEPTILIGAGYVCGGSGAGAYDSAIDLRFVLGTYSVFDSEEQYKASGFRGGVSMRNVDFAWYPRRKDAANAAHKDEARTRLYVRVFGEDQTMLREAYTRYLEKRNMSAKKFRDLIDAFVLKHINPEHLALMMESEYQCGYENGKTDKQYEIRRVLGIRG